MGTHEYDNNMRPDNEFLAGDFYFLVEGNRSRLLDGRRTTGNIGICLLKILRDFSLKKILYVLILRQKNYIGKKLTVSMRGC